VALIVSLVRCEGPLGRPKRESTGSSWTKPQVGKIANQPYAHPNRTKLTICAIFGEKSGSGTWPDRPRARKGPRPSRVAAPCVVSPSPSGVRRCAP